jgi:SAM-dependent methyltransferase
LVVRDRTNGVGRLYGGSGDDMTDYDSIGCTYVATRRPDPRIAAAVRDALGEVRSVVNVGAGAGAYEPPDLEVVAVEPSSVMIAQRSVPAARVLRASAERLPLEDGSVDAAMAILSDHHWSDRVAGLGEMLRVARRRVVLLNADPDLWDRFWLSRDYLPEFRSLIPTRYRVRAAWREELRAVLGEVEFRVLPIPWDCRDGFYSSFWRRPAAYLDPEVRANISVFQRLESVTVDAAVSRLRRDLESGAWHARYAPLVDLDALDTGFRLVIAERDAS